MKEEFLQYLWKFQHFNKLLQTTDGEKIEVITPGVQNKNAGPDFIDSRIRIGSTIWVGNVEIHVNEKEWFEHNHHKDDAYKNIILHIVYVSDKQNVNNKFPVCEIKNCFNIKLFELYNKYMDKKVKIPCINKLFEISKIDWLMWIESLLIERLENKTISIEALLNYNNNDWEDTFFQWTARSFGFNLNSLPFELTLRNTPYKILSKHFDNKFQVEAMLFGQAGFLNSENPDLYESKLRQEYVFLQRKYNLKPIETHIWKFLRLRPYNFPTIRLSQFADLIVNNNKLLSKVLECRSVEELKEMYRCTASEYWNTHYVFGKESKQKIKALGDNSINLLIINSILPFLFVYGKKLGVEEHCAKALNFYSNLEGEKNSIIELWSESGIDMSKADTTQSLIELTNSYCFKKRCLHCRIGNIIFKNYK